LGRVVSMQQQVKTGELDRLLAVLQGQPEVDGFSHAGAGLPGRRACVGRDRRPRPGAHELPGPRPTRASPSRARTSSCIAGRKPRSSWFKVVKLDRYNQKGFSLLGEILIRRGQLHVAAKALAARPTTWIRPTTTCCTCWRRRASVGRWIRRRQSRARPDAAAHVGGRELVGAAGPAGPGAGLVGAPLAAHGRSDRRVPRGGTRRSLRSRRSRTSRRRRHGPRDPRHHLARRRGRGAGGDRGRGDGVGAGAGADVGLGADAGGGAAASTRPAPAPQPLVTQPSPPVAPAVEVAPRPPAIRRRASASGSRPARSSSTRPRAPPRTSSTRASHRPLIHPARDIVADDGPVERGGQRVKRPFVLLWSILGVPSWSAARVYIGGEIYARNLAVKRHLAAAHEDLLEMTAASLDAPTARRRRPSGAPGERGVGRDAGERGARSRSWSTATGRWRTSRRRSRPPSSA